MRSQEIQTSVRTRCSRRLFVAALGAASVVSPLVAQESKSTSLVEDGKRNAAFVRSLFK